MEEINYIVKLLGKKRLKTYEYQKLLNELVTIICEEQRLLCQYHWVFEELRQGRPVRIGVRHG
jgi:hypothetical protein